MKLRARWLGSLPRVGDYLMSPTRPRFAYRILDVPRDDPRVGWDVAAKKESRKISIVVDRVACTAVPPTARVHDWRWDRRD